MIEATELLIGDNTKSFADNDIFILATGKDPNEVTSYIAQLAKNVNALPKDKESLTLKILGNHPTIFAIIALFKNNSLFIISSKNMVFCLKRGTRFAKLFEGEGTVIGPLLPDDIVLLATQSFLTVSPLTVLTIQALHSTSEEFRDDLIQKTKSQNVTENAGCLILYNNANTKTNTVQEKQELVIHEEKKEKLKETLQDRFLKKLPQHTKMQRLTILAGVILTILLTVSLIFGSRERLRVMKEQQFTELISYVEPKLTEASSLVSVSPKDTQIILEDIQRKLDESKGQFSNTTAQYSKIQDLYKKLDELKGRAEKKYIISEPPLYFDLNWIKEGATAIKIISNKSKLVVLDVDKTSVYEIKLPQKNGSIIASGEFIKNIHTLTASPNKNYLIKNDGSRQIVTSENTVVATLPEDSGEIIDIVWYAENLYVLDANNQIWKLPGTENGFGSARPWLNDDALRDFSNAISMSINGSIWVLTKESILKFTMGSADAFFIKGEEITDAKKLWISENNDELFVLDNTRIIILGKTGDYKEQYVWDGFSEINDFTVIENGQKILIGGQGVIRYIDRIK